MHYGTLALLAKLLQEAQHVKGILCAKLRRSGWEQGRICRTSYSVWRFYGSRCTKIRINSTGSCEYFQFEAKPHPPVRPMAYVQGGLGNLMMM